MKILKEQDEEDWAKMTEEYNSSEEEDDEENFAWHKGDDDQTYFTLRTKYKNIYNPRQQLFHCYDLQKNRFLLLNYGLCMNKTTFTLYIHFFIRFD